MKVIKKTNNALLLISALFIAFSTALATVNAFIRYFADFNLVWSEELATYLIVIAVFIAQPFLEHNNDQLRITFIDSLVENENIQKFFYIAQGVVTIFIMFLLVRYGIVTVKATYLAKAVTYILQFPRYILFAITTGAFVLVTISWISNLIFKREGKI